jgi:hypothetical protein
LDTELAEFPDEETPVRDALWFCDLTTSPDGMPTTLEQRVAEIERRYGPDDVVSCFVRWAWPELKAAVDRTEERLRVARIQV